MNSYEPARFAETFIKRTHGSSQAAGKLLLGGTLQHSFSGFNLIFPEEIFSCLFCQTVT